MARQKQPTPTKRQPSSELIQRIEPDRRFTPVTTTSNVDDTGKGHVAVQSAGSAIKATSARATATQAGLPELIICVGGIYASFLSWALLQERITTTSYGSGSSSESKSEVFQYPVFLNTVQSLFAALTGYVYLYSTTPRSAKVPAIFPRRAILAPMTLVAVTSSLASPFGYASLKHIDYITFILAKSCKLLPVMALHLTVFRKRFPLYKYAVVALVTAGVAVFTVHHPSTSTKSKGPESSSVWGLALLGINLLFDGLTNSTQDHIFASFQPFSGPQMMCAQNVLNTVLTTAYLLASPYLAQTAIGAYLGLEGRTTTGGEWEGEFGAALAFIRRHPAVGRDVLGFAACGAIGQVFIFYTLSTFSSLLLVTWLGVGLVFGGVGAEGVIQRVEKSKSKSDAQEKKAV
ncbi:MAG: UDP-galactose transporter [Thelocarpon superellum]|nr:MAG: UDP-galactose transporter [Thelocarpon superellum]